MDILLAVQKLRLALQSGTGEAPVATVARALIDLDGNTIQADNIAQTLLTKTDIVTFKTLADGATFVFNGKGQNETLVLDGTGTINVEFPAARREGQIIRIFALGMFSVVLKAPQIKFPIGPIPEIFPIDITGYPADLAQHESFTFQWIPSFWMRLV